MDLLIGGARSGKSALGQRMAAATGLGVVAVVTARPDDEEMADRIARHAADRPRAWTTLEAPLDLRGALATADPSACLLVDCLSVWASNRMGRGDDEDTIVAAATADAAVAAARSAPVIAVTNEVGAGLVPMHPVGRAYRDALGRVNAAWSAAAARTWLVVAGRVLELGPPPA